MPNAQPSLFESPPPRPAPPPDPYTVSRYRLALVREDADVYDVNGDAEHLATADNLAAWLRRRIFDDEPREIMVAAYLDARMRLIGWSVAYQGGLSRCTVEPRGILTGALLANAYALVLAHNHPSGDPAPSADDLALTRRIADGAETLGIHLADHIIVGDRDRWVSLKKRGGWS